MTFSTLRLGLLACALLIPASHPQAQAKYGHDAWHALPHPSFSSPKLHISVEPLVMPQNIEYMRVERTNGKTSRVRLPAAVGYLATITEIRPDIFLLTEASFQPYSSFFFYDSRTDALTREVWCYDPIPSPNGRWIIYKRFFPAHFLETMSLASNYAMLWDTTKSVMANIEDRPALVDPAHRGELGHLLYPNTWELKPGPDGDGLAYDFVTFFLWSAGSKRVVFMEEHQIPQKDYKPTGNFTPSSQTQMQPDVNLVMIDLSGKSPRVSTAPIRECALSSGETCGLALTGARFTADGIVVKLDPDVAVGRKTEDKLIRYAEFRPYPMP